MFNKTYDSGYHSFAAVYDRLTCNIDYRSRAKYFDRILQKMGVKEGILLDLACGTGKLARIFCEMGYSVIGVDKSSEMLSIAALSSPHIPFLCQDICSLDLYGTVTAAICALDGLNHLLTAAQFIAACQRVFLFLEPGGIFIFDVNTVYKHEKILKNHTFVYEDRDVYLVWKNTLLARHVVQMDLDIFTQERKSGLFKREREVFAERAYDANQIIHILKKVGFTDICLYKADTFSRPKQNTQRIVFCSRRP